MAAEKFDVLNRSARCHYPATVNSIVKAAGILHNYARKRDRMEYRTQDYSIKETVVDLLSDIQVRNLVINEESTPSTLRSYLTNHFLSSRASLPWQWKLILGRRHTE
ncbi:hypothetical protein QYM36_014635 [Artemia franciscana]|uniref:Uncharacterized protein n=1 Tax=Artemia franciscana TaxID=6661 RepID=A0AA88L3M5_ARTSF|nr:hypothetical protein QYM36_014635 [Artemia franciscana]